MSFLAIIIAGAALALCVTTICINRLTRQGLKEKVSTEIPDCCLLKLERVTRECNKEYNITYHAKARLRNGTQQDLKIRCNSSELEVGTRIAI